MTVNRLFLETIDFAVLHISSYRLQYGRIFVFQDTLCIFNISFLQKIKLFDLKSLKAGA